MSLFNTAAGGWAIQNGWLREITQFNKPIEVVAFADREAEELSGLLHKVDHLSTSFQTVHEYTLYAQIWVCGQGIFERQVSVSDVCITNEDREIYGKFLDDITLNVEENSVLEELALKVAVLEFFSKVQVEWNVDVTHLVSVEGSKSGKGFRINLNPKPVDFDRFSFIPWIIVLGAFYLWWHYAVVAPHDVEWQEFFNEYFGVSKDNWCGVDDYYCLYRN